MDEMGREPCSSMKTCFRMAGAPAPLKVAMHSVFPRSMLNYHRFQTDNIASFFKGQRIENPDAYLMCVQAGESVQLLRQRQLSGLVGVLCSTMELLHIQSILHQNVVELVRELSVRHTQHKLT